MGILEIIHNSLVTAKLVFNYKKQRCLLKINMDNRQQTADQVINECANYQCQVEMVAFTMLNPLEDGLCCKEYQVVCSAKVNLTMLVGTLNDIDGVAGIVVVK